MLTSYFVLEFIHNKISTDYMSFITLNKVADNFVTFSGATEDQIQDLLVVK